MTKRHNGEGSIYPYRNGFAAHVWVTSPTGRRQRRWVYGKTWEETHAKWLALTGEAQRGPMVTKIPTVGQYLYRWLAETVAPNLAPLTYATYESHVRWYLDPGIGKIRLDRLRVSDVQSWLNKLQSRCQCCAQGKDAKRAARDPARAKCCAKGECCRSYPSGRTIKDLRGVLRSALSSAMTEELVSRNVATMVKAPRLRPRKIVPWSSEEARRFLESARNDDDSFYAVFVLVLVLGLRKGEVLGLSWSAVDMQARELTIDQQLQRVRRELLLRETKTAASDGTLPIPDLVAAALELRRTEQGKDKAEAGEVWRGLPSGPHLVFTGKSTPGVHR
jgi:integrase